MSRNQESRRTRVQECKSAREQERKRINEECKRARELLVLETTTTF